MQYVARPTTSLSRGYLGRIEAGHISVGDTVVALPSRRTTTVRAIRTFEHRREHAGLHASVTLELDDELDISRGDLIVRANAAPAAARFLDADVAWLGDAPLDTRRTYALRHTTREVRARVQRVTDRWNVHTQLRESGDEALMMNDIGRVSLELAQPVFADRYNDNRATGSFILIDDVTNETIAAGMVR